MLPSTWQQAWDAAQPRLLSIRASFKSFPHSTLQNLRVGQLDAELLDRELLQVLTEPILKALGLVQSAYRSRLEPELNLLLHLILYHLSVWNTGATYGARLQNLRYTSRRFNSNFRRAPLACGLPHRALVLHGATNILIPYLYTRLRLHAISHAWPDAPSFDMRRKVWRKLVLIETLHNTLSSLNFLTFLYNGRYRTITDRILGLRLTPSKPSTTRQVSYEFMNRQMVWHAFTEFLIFLLPLINTRVLRRQLTRALKIPVTMAAPFIRELLGVKPFPETVKDGQFLLRGKYWSLPEDQCAICAENASAILNSSGKIVSSSEKSLVSSGGERLPQFPLHVPYITNCQHRYCYTCIADHMLLAVDEGEKGWQCLRCEEQVIAVERVDTRAKVTDEQSDMELEDVSLRGDTFSANDSE